MKILLILLPLLLFSGENIEKRIYKEKTKFKDSSLLSKIILNNRFDDKFISNISAKVGTTPVLNIYLSPFVEKLLYLRYKFIDIASTDKINYIISYSDGDIFKKEFNIKRKSKVDYKRVNLKAVNENIINKKAFEDNDIDKAILSLYGEVKYIKTVINNSPFHPMLYPKIHIKSSLDLESIAIFSNTNDKALISVINVIKNVSIIDYKFKVRIGKHGSLIIIAKSRNGEFYRYEYLIENAICISDGEEPIIDVNIN